MGEKSLETDTGTSHQGAVVMLWTPFWGALMSSIIHHTVNGINP